MLQSSGPPGVLAARYARALCNIMCAAARGAPREQPNGLPLAGVRVATRLSVFESVCARGAAAGWCGQEIAADVWGASGVVRRTHSAGARTHSLARTQGTRVRMLHTCDGGWSVTDACRNTHRVRATRDCVLRVPFIHRVGFFETTLRSRMKKESDSMIVPVEWFHP